MSSLTLTNPFDALGLPCEKHNEQAIRKAFRKAAPYCHPDARPKKKIEPDRWPQHWQLCDARDWLDPKHENHDERLQDALEKFKDFPQTFFPGETPTFRSPHPLPFFLRNCNVCQAIMLRDELDYHLGREHQLVLCLECHELIGVRDNPIDEHYVGVHDFHTCEFCHMAISPGTHEAHEARFHICPICNTHHCSIIDHMEQGHQLERCEGCDNRDDPVAHITTMHATSKCHGCGKIEFDNVMLQHLEEEHSLRPCTGCESQHFWDHIASHHRIDKCELCGVVYMEQGLLYDHLSTNHGVQLCPSCPSDMSFDMRHIASHHPLRECKVCRVLFQAERIVTHQRFAHDWVICDVCGSAEPDEDALRKHREHHRTCDMCHQMFTQEQYRLHLHEAHELLACPLCDQNLSPTEMRRHFRKTHRETNPCPICRCPQAENDLSHHMMEVHQWVKCRFCSESFSELGQRSLHEKDMHQARPCSDCGQEVAESQSREHLIREHGYKACPFCSHLSTGLLGHIHEKHPLSGKPTYSEPKPHGQMPKTPPSHVSTKASEYVQQSILHEGRATASRVSPALEAQLPQTHQASSDTPQTLALAASKDVTSTTAENGTRRSSRLENRPQKRHAPSSISATPRKKVKAFKSNLDTLMGKVTSQETTRLFVQTIMSDHKALDLLFLKDVNQKGQGVHASISRISLFVDRCASTAGFAKICEYRGLSEIARLLDITKEHSARQRVDSSEYTNILKLKNHEDNDQNRNMLRRQVKLGRQLRKICGPYDGLLCFLAITDANLWNSLKFTDNDLNRFHTSLGGFGHLWAAGSKYLELLDSGAIPSDKVRVVISDLETIALL